MRMACWASFRVAKSAGREERHGAAREDAQGSQTVGVPHVGIAQQFAVVQDDESGGFGFHPCAAFPSKTAPSSTRPFHQSMFRGLTYWRNRSFPCKAGTDEKILAWAAKVSLE